MNIYILSVHGYCWCFDSVRDCGKSEVESKKQMNSETMCHLNIANGHITSLISSMLCNTELLQVIWCITLQKYSRDKHMFLRRFNFVHPCVVIPPVKPCIEILDTSGEHQMSYC